MLVDEGGPTDKMGILLATKKGNRIRNARPQEVCPESMLARERIWKNVLPGIQTRSLSATYNCYGMVFASRRTCIEEDQIEMILDDDGYNRVVDADLKIGDIVIYRKSPGGKITHVAMIVRLDYQAQDAEWEITVLSQWGMDGEYFHGVDEVPPLYGPNKDFYTDRRL